MRYVTKGGLIGEHHNPLGIESDIIVLRFDGGATKTYRLDDLRRVPDDAPLTKRNRQYREQHLTFSCCKCSIKVNVERHALKKHSLLCVSCSAKKAVSS